MSRLVTESDPRPRHYDGLLVQPERKAPAHAHNGATRRHNGQVGPDVFSLCSTTWWFTPLRVKNRE